MKLGGLGVTTSAVLLAFGLGCQTTKSPKNELIVSAAISLKHPMEELAAAYREKHEDIELRLNFGSSGLLSSQIVRGAPVDV